jgi:iron complex outermembrane receptor protein
MYCRASFQASTAASSVLAVALAGHALDVRAQEGAVLEQVIVTAQKREENIQQVPIAITAVTAAQLQSKGISSFSEVLKSTPNIAFGTFPSSSNSLVYAMRGMSGGGAPISAEGAIGVYEDGFVMARSNVMTFDLSDIERVEILRGPQGTLYGRNTTGGAINMVSRKPTGEFGLRQTLELGSRNLVRSLTTVDLPKWGGLSAKATLLKSEIDGWVKNAGDSHDYGEQGQTGGRVQLRWDNDGPFTADLFSEYGEVTSTPPYFQNPTASTLNGGLVLDGIAYTDAGPRKRTWRALELPLSKSEFWGHGLTLSYEVNDSLTVKSLTGYRDMSVEDHQNYADSFIANLQSPEEEPFLASGGYISHDEYRQHQFSEELQLIGDLFDGRISYVAGLYYFSEAGAESRPTGSSVFAVYVPSGTTPPFDIYNTPVPTAITAEGTSKAAFGQVTWRPALLEQRLEFTLGARYTKDERTSRDLIGLEGGSKSFSRFNPMFTANYRLTDDINVYGKVTTGYRAGGFYFYGGSKPDRSFDPELLTTYETGLKSTWFEQRARLNAAVFTSKFRDMQLIVSDDPQDITRSSTYNLGRSTISGLELELLVSPIDALTLSANYSYLDVAIDHVDVPPGSLFDHASNASSPYNAGDNIAELFSLPYSPRSSYDLAADYRFLNMSNGELSAHVDYRWQATVQQGSAGGAAVPGRQYDQVPDYGLLNARLTYDMQLPGRNRLSVSLWGKNLTDEKYPLYSIPFVGGQVPVGQIPAGYSSAAIAWSQPISYGVSLNYQY